MRASMDMVRPHCQPLHIQSSSDDSHLLTTLTTPRRAHQGGGRQRGPGWERPGDGEDAAVESQTERTTRVN
jgi:hypothetical protein